MNNDRFHRQVQLTNATLPLTKLYNYFLGDSKPGLFIGLLYILY